MIKDSGNRREFTSGAVRDIQEGKGRCDLLPLDVVCGYYEAAGCPGYGQMFYFLNKFKETADVLHLYAALRMFLEISPFCEAADMFLEVSKHFEEGAKKYGEHNWQKGIPVDRYIDSAVRHYLKCLRGDTDERHDRALAWNICCLIWTVEHKPSDADKLEEGANG